MVAKTAVKSTRNSEETMTTRPDFAPLVLQLANHVARRPPVDAPSVVLADGTAEFVVNGLWGDVKAAVKKPSGGEPTRQPEMKACRCAQRSEP